MSSKGSFYTNGSSVGTVTNPAGPASTPVSSTATPAPSSFYKGTGPSTSPALLTGIPAFTPIPHNWLTGLTITGLWLYAQPSALDLSDGVTGSGKVVLQTSPDLEGNVTVGGVPQVTGFPSRLQIATDPTLWHSVYAIYGNNPNEPALAFIKTRGANPTTHVAVNNGDYTFGMYMGASDGTAYITSMAINGFVDGPVSAGVVPMAFAIYTGSTDWSYVERFRISSAGLATFTGDLHVNGSTGITLAADGKLFVSNNGGIDFGFGSSIVRVAADGHLQFNSQAGLFEFTGAINANSAALTNPLPATSGGTSFGTYALGDTLYSSATNTLAKLAGNITTTRKFVRQTGTGAVSAAPVWDTILAADIPASALTKVDDTNVTLALGGSPTTSLLAAASLTLGWTGTLAVTRGGTGLGSATLGDIHYASAANTLAALAGNITTTRKFLRQTGTGAVSAAPVWDTILAADIPGSALTKVDDTNVTLTLGGSPTTALLNAASLTLGWTGALGVSRGGTGVSASSGVALDNITGFNSTGFLKRTGSGTYSFIADPLPVANGGTGDTTLTSNGVLYGNGTAAVQATAQGAANTVLTANAGAPSFSAAPTIGTSVTTPLLIGGTAAGSSLTLESTSGAGTTDSIIFKTGSQATRLTLDTLGVASFSSAATAAAASAIFSGAGTAGSSIKITGTAAGVAPWELVCISTAGGLGGAFAVYDTTSGAVNMLFMPAFGGNLSFAPLGYPNGVGLGGAVSQLTNKGTSVTLNTICGQITMNAAALAANTTITFQLFNSLINSTDVIIVNHISGGTGGSYTINPRGAAAGSVFFNVRNITAGSLSEAIVLGYAVIKSGNS